MAVMALMLRGRRGSREVGRASAMMTGNSSRAAYSSSGARHTRAYSPASSPASIKASASCLVWVRAPRARSSTRPLSHKNTTASAGR